MLRMSGLKDCIRSMNDPKGSELLPPPSLVVLAYCNAQPNCVPGVQLLEETSKHRSSPLLGCGPRQESYLADLLFCLLLRPPSSLGTCLVTTGAQLPVVTVMTAALIVLLKCCEAKSCQEAGQPALLSFSAPGSPCSVELPCTGCALTLSSDSSTVTGSSLSGSSPCQEKQGNRAHDKKCRT